MCRRLEACVESPAAAQITVSTVHKAKGLEWPRVLVSSDFNQFVELKKGKPVIDMEEAYIMYVALTRAREKLILSPACVEAISASAATKAGRAPHPGFTQCQEHGAIAQGTIPSKVARAFELTAHCSRVLDVEKYPAKCTKSQWLRFVSAARDHQAGPTDLPRSRF